MTPAFQTAIMSYLPSIYSLWACVLIVYLCFKFAKFYNVHHQLRGIPSMGSSSIFLFYINALKFVWSSREIMQEGYKKV